MFTLVLLLSSLGSLVAMDKAPATIVFLNRQAKPIEIPREIVRKSRLLNNEYQKHKLYSSIGTQGHVSLESPDLQNIELLKKCLEYDSYTPEQLRQNLTANVTLDTIGNSVKIMEMSEALGLLHISKSIAQTIASTVHSQKRCDVFETGILNCLQSKPAILNLIAQEILAQQDKTTRRDTTKEYWITKAIEKNKNLEWGIKEQLNKHMTPAKALVLLDSYEHKALGKPLSFEPGMEQIVSRDLQDLVKPSFGAAFSYRWSRIDPKVKWSIAGLGATTLAAAGYGLYNWYMSK